MLTMPSTAKKDSSESIPLDETPSPLIEEKPGYFIPKAKIIAVIVVVVVLVVIVIVLAVCLGVATSSQIKERLEVPTQLNATVTTTSVAPTTAGTEAWWNPRLPTNVIPTHYNLFLNVTVDQPHFDGRVDIDVEVKYATDLIILHSKGINISTVEIRGKLDKRVAPVLDHFTFSKYDYHVIQMEAHLQPGRYLLKLVFDAFFSTDENTGMYRGSFKRSSDGKEVNFAATQFEDIDARKAFPCFDEPAMKATFNVTIAHRPDHVALCNMPVYRTETIANERFDHFSKSVVMPTYLVAFVVGDFAVKQGVSKNNITMRYFSRPSFVQKLDYALSVGGKIMTYFENLFDVKYSLPKEDMVALPQFDPGAMENWGLILYREQYLLWDEKESTENAKILVASVMTHELIHMWFGNIVTLNWWNDIWLNEGFAKAFESRGIAVAEPEWKNVDKAIYEALWRSMTYDSTIYSNPVSEDAKSLNNTGEMSGVIYYDKASCVIRMLEGFLGEKTFIDGLKIYLNRHAFANAVTDDVWRALTEASCARGECMDIKQIMDPWTLQMGFPVVTFKKKNATHYTVSQSHFKTSPNATYRKSDFGYSWVIPLTYAIKDQGSSFTWMNMSSATIRWDGKGWIKANTDHNGYYLTNYDESNWMALAEQLNINHTVFSASDRAGMLLDLAQLLDEVRPSRIEYSTVFALAEYMRNETDFVPWRMMLPLMSGLLRKLPRTSKAYRYLLKYMIFLGKSEYDRLGFKDSGSSTDKILRVLFLDFFCEAKVESCTNKAQKLFKAWMDKPNENSIPVNLKATVQYYGVAHGGLEEWDFLYNQYNNTVSKEGKKYIIYGLAASREPWILERYLWYLLDPLRFTLEDRLAGFQYVCFLNPYGAQIAWGFLRVNFAKLQSVFGLKTTYYSLVPAITSQFNTQFMLEEFNRFIKQISGRTDKGQESKIKAQIDWLARNQKTIEDALEKLLVKNNIL